MTVKKATLNSLIEVLDFTNNNKKPIPIYLLTKDGFKVWKKKASAFHQKWAFTQNYSCIEANVLVLPDDKGGIFEVLCGTKDNTPPKDPFFYSKLASNLPNGAYTIKTALTKNMSFQASLGWCLFHYKFDKYKTDPRLELKTLKAPINLNKQKLEATLRAISITRDLINTPANDLGPKDLSDFAKTLSKIHKARFKVIIGDNLLKSGFPTIHAVGRASVDAPRLIDFSWGIKNNPKITLVGKGVCFDSGGLDIKPSGGMRWMKKDMGGAAHALGLASAIMELKLPVQLRVIIPAVENSISANAFRPGDVIKSRKGINIEIGHTDAEGRLILCDALALADEETPDLLIDFATLTGAARVALGPDLPAFFTNDDDFANNLLKIGTDINDPMWRMPLWQPYNDDLISSIADVNNIGESGLAGAITAALFLEKFVANSTNWAHLDIFGWSNNGIPGRPIGGEAQTIRAILTYIENRYC
jgi:leucyl aminopeptidase